MYKDVITYQLAENITEEYLLSVAEKIIESWMRKQPGFQKWEIHTNSDGSYTDIVYWDSAESAKKAEAQMAHIPNAADWYACYLGGSISTKHLHSVAEYQ